MFFLVLKHDKKCVAITTTAESAWNESRKYNKPYELLCDIIEVPNEPIQAALLDMQKEKWNAEHS